MPEEAGPSSRVQCPLTSPVWTGWPHLCSPARPCTMCWSRGWVLQYPAGCKGHLLFYPSYLPHSQWGKGSPGALRPPWVSAVLWHTFFQNDKFTVLSWRTQEPLEVNQGWQQKLQERQAGAEELLSMVSRKFLKRFAKKRIWHLPPLVRSKPGKS